MVITACALIGGGIGALIGGLAMTTEKGREVNKNMEDAWDKYKEDIKELSAKKNMKDLIERK